MWPILGPRGEFVNSEVDVVHRLLEFNFHVLYRVEDSLTYFVSHLR